MMDTKLIPVIISQYIHISNHDDERLKLLHVIYQLHPNKNRQFSF